MGSKLTDKEMEKYREIFFGLPFTTSVSESVELGINSGIPIEYFIEVGIINNRNYTELEGLEDAFGKIRKAIEKEDAAISNQEDENSKSTGEYSKNIGEYSDDTEEYSNIRENNKDKIIEELRHKLDKIINEKEQLEKYIGELEIEVTELKNEKEKARKNIVVQTREVPIITNNKREKALVISSYANKGGVGKTTVAVSIAKVIAEMGRKTIICDFDYSGSNIASFFSLDNEFKNYYRGISKLDEYIVRLSDNLYMLPGSKDIYAKDVKSRGVEKVLDKLSSMFEVIVCDTCPAPYDKDYMHKIFEKTDIVYAVVNQSKFSRDETRAYVPKMIFMGVSPDKIRIVVNQFDDKLVSIKQVESDFNSGLKIKSGNIPKVSAVIPEDWVGVNKAIEMGEVLNKEIWGKLCEEINYLWGIGDTNNEVKERKRSIFSR